MKTASEAAQRLGVTDSRVRALIAAGTLQAERFGSRWAIDDDSLDLLASRQRRRGHRAMSSRMAWAAAAQAEGVSADWATASERSRLRHLLADQADRDTWLARMSARANTVTTGHTSSNIIADKRVLTANFDVTASRAVTGSRTNVWVAQSDLAAVLRDNLVLDSDNPNVIIRTMSDEFATALTNRHVPALIAAADLWDEGDARSRDLADYLIARARG